MILLLYSLSDLESGKEPGSDISRTCYPFFSVSEKMNKQVSEKVAFFASKLTV